MAQIFHLKNTLIRVNELKAIHIIETEDNIDIKLKVIQRKSREEIGQINRKTNNSLLGFGRSYTLEDFIEPGAYIT